ncbi:MAG: ABC transporter ATP-binding protein, partial [Chloroflexota bacterium]
GALAVDHLDLEVEEGEFLVLLGPSGCGKTTTLRMIAGLEVQTEGKITLEGKDISDSPPERRDMAMVFQNLALYPHMTVFDNIAFYLQNIRTPKETIEQKVRQAAKTVGIVEFLARYPNQLSGGQRQRVALARALVRSPKVFLLDEPLSSLDAKLRAGMRSELKLLHRNLSQGKERKGTFIYVTHDQVEALTLGTRVAVMNKGNIVQLSTPRDLYNKPRNLFASTFVGSPSMNLIEGSLERENGSAAFHFQGNRIALGAIGLAALNRANRAQMPAILGVRPESVKIATPGTPDALSAQVVTVEPLGQNNLINLQVGDRMLIALVSPDLAIHEGENVNVCFQSQATHLFDPQTEENLLG